MNNKDTEHFKSLLLKLKDVSTKQFKVTEKDLVSNIKDSTGEISSYSFHMADMGSDSIEREKQFILASKDTELIQALDHALSKIESDEYGICEQCDKPISHQRLEVVPYAKLCLECKSKEEITST